MSRGKIVCISPEAHHHLKLLAARRGRSMGELVANLVEQELADLANPWTDPEGLWVQQKALAEVWSDPALDVIIAAITSTQSHKEVPSKVVVEKDSPEGRRAGLKIDSVVDCQTLATIPRSETVARIGRFSDEVIARINRGLQDALGL